MNGHTTATRRRVGTIAAALLIGSGLAAIAPPVADGASTELSVDLAARNGAFRGGASGVLYGLYDQDVPSNNLIEGMGLQTTDTKAQDGQQHPGSDALEVAKPLCYAAGTLSRNP